MAQKIPGWFVFHVPHDSTSIPDNVRHQFALSEIELADELLKMTDHHTLDLFTDAIPAQQIVRAEVSRLVVDVERFADDSKETMSAVGMGAVYLRTHNGSALRHPLTDAERNALISEWYTPHHNALTNKVETALEHFGKCLVVDCHSFPSTPLPYESEQSLDRPEFCIGTNAFHTPAMLADGLMEALLQEGFSIRKNFPFDGALVPMKFYNQDNRVSAVMIEVRRDLYMDEVTADKSNRFGEIAKVVRRLLITCADYI